jgi:hypothetical protein
VRLALRLIVEEAREGEVSDALGRERYERGEDYSAAIWVRLRVNLEETLRAQWLRGYQLVCR